MGSQAPENIRGILSLSRLLRAGTARGPSIFKIVYLFAALTLLVTGCQKEKPVVELKAYPPQITFTSAKAKQRIVVQATLPDGTTMDVTVHSRYRLKDPRLARIEQGALSPRTNGQTTLTVSYAEHLVEVPVKVAFATNDAALSFSLDVMPVFMKAGCNAGSCHGSSRGKDGFRLSLFGFDPEGDYYRLTREQIGRRINLAVPEESLIVQKGLGMVQHTGGERFKTNSQLCQTLVAWLQAGAPKDPPTVPKLAGLEIFPTTAVLEGSNTLQHFVARAHYSDNSERDVTPLTVFLSNNEVTARVADDGTVTAGQRGEAFIQARFGEFNVGAQIIVIPKNVQYAWSDAAVGNYLDEAVDAKLRKLRLNPSDLCDDATFLRRASLDITGTLPSSGEVRDFLANADSAKRGQLIDRLLERKEFADLWVMKWAELLEIRSRDNRVFPKATVLYFEWLRDQMMADVPVDKIVRALLTANGSNFRNPPANYLEVEQDTLKIAENTAQIFMGMRIQCAQCHNHPFDRWTMNDYYGFAAFFSQVGRKAGDDPRENVVFDKPGGEVKHPVTGATMKPKFLGGETPEIKNETRREALAQWLTAPENPYFAKNLANLVWTHFMGRGIIEPVDDVRISNPPSNPELLDALARHLVQYKFDFKKIVRDVCASRAYQRSTRANSINAGDERNFSKASLRRIRAEILLDCISEVTETKDKFNGLPRGARAVQIADGNTANYFLTTFGRATRTTVCSCEVKVDPNLSQALHLLNGDTVQNKIEQGGLVKRLLKAGHSPEEVLDELYLRCLARLPDAQEKSKLAPYLQQDGNPEQILNDLFWALLNSKEFVFDH
jgi:hypothetical protein